MFKTLRTFSLSFTIVALLLFSAFGTTKVYADGGTTTDTSTSGNDSGECSSQNNNEETADTSNNEGESDDCNSNSNEETTDTSAVESDSDSEVADTGDSGNSLNEETATADVAQAAETVIEETESSTETSLLSEVPDNTTVTVLDADGQTEPLATENAATAIATTSDPIWCPQGQPPTPGANGCTASFSSFDELLTLLAGNAAYQTAGTIYVQQGAYNGGESSIDFNSYDLSNISNSDLAVQGGWNTTTNTVDPTSTSNFTIPIFIGTSANPWGGSLTFNNILIQNVTDTGLILYSANDINISNVEVTNSTNGGGAELNAGGDVTISNSKFLRNKTTGAAIHAGGNVAIANSEFSNPELAYRQNTGLEITSTGSVSLFSVLVNHNRKVGAIINSDGRVSIDSSVFSSNMSQDGSTYNGYGLQVITPDGIDLANVEANNNFLWGADLDAGGDVAIIDSVFNGNSTFSNIFIDDTGLLIKSGGKVSLNNVEANNNRLIGAVIEAVGDVSVNNSTFTNNKGETTSGGITTYYGYGLQAVTLGNIFLNGVNASDNTLFGAHLDAGGDVAITNSNFNNQTSGSTTDQTGRGLEVISGSNVYLTNVAMDNNQLFGGSIQVTGNALLDALAATNNGGDGLEVTASCTSVTDGSYSGNGQYGLNLTNPALTLSGTPTFVNNGAGDIFPATFVTCTPVFTPVNPGNTGEGSSLLQTVSYTTQGGTSATSLFGGSLNSLWFGTGNTDATSPLFSGNYIIVYSTSEGSSSIEGLQIIAVVPISGGQMVKAGN